MSRETQAVAVVLLAIVGLAPAQTRLLKPDDVYRLRSVTDPQLSPEGDLVAYVVTTVDPAKNKRQSTIWIAPADGSAQPRSFMSNLAARSPRWSPDGNWLAFITTSASAEGTADATPAPNRQAPAADAKSQVWVISRDGKVRRVVTHLPNGVSRFSWSPDGTRLAVTSRQGGKARDVRHYTSIFYKSDDSGWSDNQRTHIWIVDVKDGAERQLTSGDRNENDPQWSPDGKWIAYLADRMGPDLRETGLNDILLSPSAGGEPRAIVERRAYLTSPRWAPDGKRLAFGAAPTSADQPLVWTIDPFHLSKPEFAGDIDLFPTQIEWTPKGLWFGTADRGAATIYRIDVATHRGKKVVSGERAVHELRINEKANRLIYLVNDDNHPPEVFTSAVDGTKERQITFHNRELLAEVQLGRSERLSWKSVDGLAIEGFLLRPMGWQAGRKYPMILNIHGGPNGMFGFHWSIDEQLYAANGYAVLMTNPRGSSGYGSKFQRAVAREWGGKAYEDIMSGVDAVLAREPWIDSKSIGVVGHSYGGFMTNWIVTQTSRFKAAISISGIADFISVQGTRDGAYGHSRDFGGDLFESFDTYWKYSPLRLARNVKTPILFLHGEADQRVPFSQAEEYFRAIKHLGGTAELVIFPRENHMLPVSSEPKHLVETFAWRLYWFERYLKGSGQAVAPDAVETAANDGRPSR